MMYLVVIFSKFRKEHRIKFIGTFKNLEDADTEAQKYYDPPEEFREKMEDVIECHFPDIFDEYSNEEYEKIKDIIAPIIPMNIHKKEEWDIDLSIGNIIQAHKVLIKYNLLETYNNCAAGDDNSIYEWNNPYIGIFYV
jgi:hypothetical protein